MECVTWDFGIFLRIYHRVFLFSDTYADKGIVLCIFSQLCIKPFLSLHNSLGFKKLRSCRMNGNCRRKLKVFRSWLGWTPKNTWFLVNYLKLARCNFLVLVIQRNSSRRLSFTRKIPGKIKNFLFAVKWSFSEEWESSSSLECSW